MSTYSQPNSRAPSRSPSEPPAKRKKLSTACDACQRRKSRCEMITSKGCHRCRTLGTECSRAGHYEGADETAGAGPSNHAREPREMENAHDDGPASFGVLQDIQARTRRMESMLETMMRQSGERRERTPILSQSAPADGEARELQPSVESGGALTNRALCLPRTRRLTDPVGAGLISLPQWIGIYENFKRHIDAVIPLSTLLPLSPPTDPLLRTCILVYQAGTLQFRQSSSPTAYLINHLRANLDRLPLSPPSREAMLALLILSLAPPTVEEGGTYTPPDRHSAAARAVEMGYALGIDGAIHRVTCREQEDRSQDWMRQDLDDVKLWYATLQRARWVEYMNAPALSVRHLITSYIPADVLRPQDLPNDRLFYHLILESELYQRFDSVLAALRSLRTARSYDSSQIDQLVNAVQSYDTDTLFTRQNMVVAMTHCPSAAVLILTNYLFDVLLFLNVSSFGNLPTPLGLEVCSRLPREYTRRIHSSSVSALNFLIDNPNLPLGHLPAFTFTLIILAYKCISQSRKLNEAVPSRHSTPTSTDSPKIDHDHLIQIRTRLIHAHPQYTPLLATIDGADAPRVWGEAMRELQQSQHAEMGADGGWGNWEGAMFDFDAFFGMQGGQAMGLFGEDGDFGVGAGNLDMGLGGGNVEARSGRGQGQGWGAGWGL